ncbi:MAG TPA: transporter, partial [Polyangiaceae bacterium]|nr:transporter [Polyangiaceae bacterium]
VDATVYAPVPTMPGATVTLHTSGVGDATYLPTIAYFFNEDEETHTHTYVAATVYATAPTGNYDSARPVNIGDDRWRFQPQIAAGQRFLKALTLDLIGSAAFYTDNTKFGTGPGMPVVTMKQDQTFGFEAHVAADLSPTFYLAASYYLAAVGQRSITAPGLPETVIDDEQTTQTLRFTFGVHVEKGTLLLLQYNQDIEASGGGTISRFVGARLSHVFVP